MENLSRFLAFDKPARRCQLPAGAGMAVPRASDFAAFRDHRGASLPHLSPPPVIALLAEWAIGSVGQ